MSNNDRTTSDDMMDALHGDRIIREAFEGHSEGEKKGLEMAATYMERRADACELSNGGGPTQSAIAQIFRAEAEGIRKLADDADISSISVEK